jgi:hypothetical protein
MGQETLGATGFAGANGSRRNKLRATVYILLDPASRPV